MARTFRRKGDKKRNKGGRSHFEKEWTYEYAWEVSYGTYGACPLVPIVGREYWVKYHFFHSDNFRHGSYRKSWRSEAEQICRARNKQQIMRYLRDPNYEVMEIFPECLSWYDHYSRRY